MAVTSSEPVPGANASDKTLNITDLIDRLAEELRMKGDVHQPHSYFVEQVKLMLAGRDMSTPEAANDAALAVRRHATMSSSSVFHAWALSE